MALVVAQDLDDDRMAITFSQRYYFSLAYELIFR